MRSSCYSMAGVVLKLESDTPIKSNGMLQRFAVQKSDFDVKVKVYNAKGLPEKGEKLIFRDDRRTVYENNGVRQSYCCYYDSMLKTYVPYSCLVGNGGEYELYVNYKNGEIWETMVLDSLDFPNILLPFGAAVIHCSFIIRDGRAIIFTADKQVGKSTQAALWEKYAGAEIVNGDRAAIKNENGVLYACGVPFCGSSDICENKQAPVAAIVELSQGGENVLSVLSQAEAFRCILGKLSYNVRDKAAAVRAADIAAFASQNAVYHLSCLPDEEAVKVLEEEIWKR